MSDLLSRLESRIRQAVEKIEEYQLEISELKAQNLGLEKERQEMHDKLALLIDSFEELEAAAQHTYKALVCQVPNQGFPDALNGQELLQKGWLHRDGCRAANAVEPLLPGAHLASFVDGDRQSHAIALQKHHERRTTHRR